MLTPREAGLFDDEKLKTSVESGFKSIFPIETEGKILEINKIHFGKNNLDPDNWGDIKKAILDRQTVGSPIKGDFVLKDKNTGKTLSSKTINLGIAPTMTRLNTFMINGTHYNMPSQFRLRPGGYGRLTRKGEVEVFSNIENAAPIRTQIDLKKKLISLKIGQGKVPIYPILKILNVPDDKMASVMGKEIFVANASTNYENGVKKAYKALFNERYTDMESAEKRIREHFLSAKTDPETNKRTLGKGFKNIDGDYLLTTVGKVIKITKGEEKPVNRDSLIFKDVYGVEDVLESNLKSYGRSGLPRYKAKNIMRRDDDIAKIINTKAIKKQIEHSFTTSRLSRYAPQANPVAIINAAFGTTLLGEGGISHLETVPLESKFLQNTHMGFLDGSHTPECFDIKTKVFTSIGWMYFKDTTMKDKLACKIDGKLEFHEPYKLIAKHYKGAMYGARSVTMDYLVTPNHRMWCKPRSRVKKEYFPEYKFAYAADMHGKHRMHSVAHKPYEGERVESFSIPAAKSLQKIANLASVNNKENFNPIAWASFMGWYLSEGSCTIYTHLGRDNQYRVSISQSRKANPDKCNLIEAVLDELTYNWCYTSNGDYCISNKQLATYLHQFGLCDKKWIPEEFFTAQIDVRQALLDALLLGDGKIGNKRKSKPHWNSNKEYRIFFSSSKKLADGFERLAISLGYPTSTYTRSDNRKESYLDIHEVSLLIRKERTTTKRHCYIKDYDDMVYCAEVPGGKLYTKRDRHPFWSGNSKAAGITLTMSLDTKKKGRELKTKVINLLTGKTEWMSPRDLDDIPLVFPGEFKKVGNRWKSGNKKIHAIHNDKHVTIPAYRAKYMIADPQGMFDISSNLIPFLHSNQGNRGMTSAKMSEQAIALDNAELPLVETIVDGRPLMDDIGRQFSVRSDIDGEVTKITKESIIIKDTTGKSVKHYIFDNLPLNDQALLDAEVRVVVGDKVKKDQLLADSTFTKNGKYVYGVNLNTAYIPWRGKNFEDGIVITEDAAKKLSSSHIHRVTLPLSENVLTDIKKYKAYTPYGISKDDIGRYDDDGTLKKGETVKPDDILIASLKQNVLTGADTIISKLKKSAIKPYKDNALRWNKTYGGVVTDKVRHKGGIDIYVKTIEPFKVGDKIVARHGNKGVVSFIIPSEMAPVTESGEKVDIIFDSHSVVPRINPGQIIENAAGKLAQRTGKTFLVDNFSGLDYRKIIQDEMKKLGIPEKEDIYDPETGKTLPNVAIGKMYITKLRHQVDTKLSARGLSEPYTQNDQPTSGGGIGGQAVDRLTMNAMLAYNPRELMREMFSIKNNRNNAYWRAIQHGEIPPAPGPSFEYNKFEALLKSMGINTKDVGTTLKLSPLTDKDVLNLSTGDIPAPMKTFVGKGINLTPDKDGLFGEDVGGFHGNNFTHIELDTKIPSPAYKDAIKSILHLKDKDFEELLKK